MAALFAAIFHILSFLLQGYNINVIDLHMRIISLNVCTLVLSISNLYFNCNLYLSPQPTACSFGDLSMVLSPKALHVRMLLNYGYCDINLGEQI